MVIIKTIKMAGGACPYQLEGETTDGKWIYIRYRNGMLKYVVAESETAWIKNKKDSWYDFSKNIGDEFDGYAEHDVLYPHLKDHIQFPEGFKLESHRSKK